MKKSNRQSRSMARQFARDYLFVSLIPIVLLLFFVVFGSLVTKNYLEDLLQRSTHELNEDAKLLLQRQGQKIIQDKAKDVAKQIEIFLKAYPDASMNDLQDNPYFKNVAMQKVGTTGYTCLYEAGTGIMRIHPNPNLIDREMVFLAKKLPSWWAIFQPTLYGKEVSGYYDWLEPNGTIRQKYMTITPVGEKFHDITLMVAATTYIDEFSVPIVAMKNRARAITAHYQDFVYRQGFVIVGTIVVVLLLTFAGIYLLGRRAVFRYVLPIEKLAEAAKKLGEGEWEASEHIAMIKGEDEIGALVQAFSNMTNQLKELFASLEHRVAELKLTQAALKQSEEHYRGLFDGVPVGLYRTTPEGKILDANPTLVQMLGYPDQETYLAQNAADIYANPEDRTWWKAQMEGKSSVHGSEIQMRRYDGTIIWAEDRARAVRHTEGHVLYFEGSIEDITERRRAEIALRKSEEEYKKLYAESKKAEEVYRSLLHSSADPIVIYDLGGKAGYVSPAFTQVFGWTLAEVKGKRIPFVPESEREATLAIINDLMEFGTPCHGFETKRYTKDGRVLDVSISASRYDDHEGKPAGTLSILRNISGKKRLEAQLQQAQKMEAIGTLAGGIAHDFNNLLMGIQGRASLMLMDIDSLHPHFEHIKEIVDYVRSAADLTKQLLGFARGGKYEVKTTDLNELIKNQNQMFGRARKEINIREEYREDLWTVDIDQGQIQQMLLNLYVNAWQAMSGGGDLYIQTENVTVDENYGKQYQVEPGKYVRISVTDTGVGMDEATRQRVFDPFFTTKEMGRGTGLGLASAYGIIKNHDGIIDVYSEKGEGTTFNIYLPASEKKVIAEKELAEDVLKGSGTVLLVDDEEIIIDVAKSILEQLGYTVLVARGGKEAVELYMKNRKEIDLVVLDMIMPEMGGGDAYDRLKEINPDIKVLLSSGYSINGQATEILERGCSGFIQKPFSVGDLSKKIRQILDKEY